MKKPLSLIKIKKCNLEFKIPFRNTRLKVLHDITVNVYKGEFLVFLGPSGSGKSTLLRIMSGLEKDFTGEVTYDKSVTPNDMSFIFQQSALFPWLTVFQNIALGLIARGEDEIVIHKKVITAATDLGLGKFIHSFPHELSGGMKQRVGIARALVTDPKIVFMDEPFSGLDSCTATELRKELLRIWEEKNMTIVLVTHLASEAVELGDRIAVVSTRPANIEKVIVNPLVRPRKNRTKPFYALEDEIVGLVKP